MRRTYTMANTSPYTSTRICKDCGKVMTNVSNTTQSAPKSAVTSRRQHGGQRKTRRSAHRTRGGKARKPASGTQRSGMQSSGQTAGQQMPPV